MFKNRSTDGLSKEIIAKDGVDLKVNIMLSLSYLGAVAN